MTPAELWQRYQQYLCTCPSIGLSLDISRMHFPDSIFDDLADRMNAAFEAMDAIERGERANRDENHMVGHYWLRAPERAPDESTGNQIRQVAVDIKNFAAGVHSGSIAPPMGTQQSAGSNGDCDGFYVALVLGIGGSSLGPRLLCDALSTADDPMMIRFIDNTDPDGIDRTLSEIGDLLPQTLTVVMSKSGTTRETYNAMREVEAAYQRAGLPFARHAVAVTQQDSALHKLAVEQKWLEAFPLWDWVGGRTSITSAVGLLPAALQGADIDEFLAGARACDEVTRSHEVLKNPAALLAMMWYYAGNGRGERDMVVLPYRDRLALLGLYLQQLVMESIGKERDRAGRIVHQGLTVYGNKGTSDQHSFIQQLVDGLDNFFVTFIEVMAGSAEKQQDARSTACVAREHKASLSSVGERKDSLCWAEGVTSGDYLHAFRHGTREALSFRGRQSITITLDRLTARSLGALVALFERTVGLYAEIINVNAYNQPGVEAGKKAADNLIALQGKVAAFLRGASAVQSSKPKSSSAQVVGDEGGRGSRRAEGEDGISGFTAAEVADGIGVPDQVEAVYHVLCHLAATRGLVKQESNTMTSETRFGQLPNLPN
jgi:glucose-6-phosphate isomerase